MALREPLVSALPDATVLVLVDGAAGTGKTRLVKRLLALPEFGGIPHLKATFSLAVSYAQQDLEVGHVGG